MTNQRYFITGGFGFLGQFIVKAIRDHDPAGELRVQVRTPRKTLLGIESMESVRLSSSDLIKPESYEDQLDGVDTVVHNAAMVAYSRKDIQSLYESNITGTKNLLQIALERGCRNFIFISSISSVRLSQNGPADETYLPIVEEIQGTDPYGYTKLVGEQALQAEADRIHAIILNPSLIIGPGSRRIQEIVPWLRRLPVFPTLTTQNSFVDVRDVAKAVVLGLTKGASGERFIVTSDNVGMETFTRMVMDEMEINRPVYPVPERVLGLGDLLVAGLDRLHINPGLKEFTAINVDKTYSPEKIRRVMGWAPDFTLQQSIRDSIYPNTYGLTTDGHDG